MVDAAIRHGSAFTPPPPKWTTKPIPCVGELVAAADLKAWKLQWSTDPAVIAARGGGPSGRAYLFGDDKELVNRILDLKRDWAAIIPSLRDISKEVLSVPKTQRGHIDRMGKAKILATARSGLFRVWAMFPGLIRENPGWTVPAEPRAEVTHLRRPTGPNVTPLPGHLPGNVNPDHELPVFKL